MAKIYNSQLDAFELYHRTHDSHDAPSSKLLSPDGSALPALGHAIAGSVGSAISNICTYPLDLVITRLQLQRQLGRDSTTAADTCGDEGQSIQDAAWRIYETEGGVWAFYTGLLPDTGKTITDSFLFFLAYNFLRRRRTVARGGSPSAAFMLPVLDELSIGFIAGSFTKLLTTPISNIVTRKQISALPPSRGKQTAQALAADPTSSLRPLSTAQITRDILQHKGIRGFWSGYSAALVLTLNPSLTFFLFESLKRLLLPRSKRANPPPSVTFVLAAISKACASSVTYPFSVAKARAQVSSTSEAARPDKSMPSKSTEVDSASLPSSRAVRAFQTTIFSTILEIIRDDGFRALYSGLPLELSKSFLSHGITMMVKQYVHRLIIKAYYILGVMAARLRSKGLKAGAQTERLLDHARQQRYEYYDLARRRAEDRAQQVKAGAGSVAGAVRNAAGDLADKAHETADLVADYVEDETMEEGGIGKRLYGTTGLARWFEER